MFSAMPSLLPCKGMAVAALAALLALAAGPSQAQVQTEARQDYSIAGDAIPLSLTGSPGDAVRGRAIVASRQQGLCLLCHTGPIPEERFQGNLAPDLAGAGSRWTIGQLRLRIVDARHFNAETIMPSYYHSKDLLRVAGAWQDKTILTAQQIEDVVAFLATLRSDEKGNGK